MDDVISIDREGQWAERQETLLEQIRWMRLIIDSVAAIIAYIDPQQRYLFVNHGFEELLGLSRDEIIGQRMADVLSPEIYAQVADRIAAALSGEEQTYELVRQWADGTSVNLHTSYRPHFDSRGDVMGCFVIMTDVTARAQVEAELHQVTRAAELLHAIAAAANDSSGPAQAIQTCLDVICAYAGWPLGHAVMPSAHIPGEFESTRLWHVDRPGRFDAFQRVSELTSYPPGKALAGVAIAKAAPYWVFDVPSRREIARAQVAAEAGIKSAFAFPVMIGQRVAAVLEFFCDRHVEQDDQLLELTAKAGLLIGRVIERKELEDLREEAAKQLAGIVDIAHDAIISIDEEFRITLFNRGAEGIFGYSAEELIGKPLDLLLPERFRSGHSGRIAAFVEAPEASRRMADRATIYGLRKDGTEFPAQGSISKLVLRNKTMLTIILRDLGEDPRVDAATQQN